MPRPLLLLLLSILSGGITILIHEPDDTVSLQRERDRLQNELLAATTILRTSSEELLGDLSELGPEEWMRTHVKVLEQERDRTGTVFLGYRNDSLVCWTGPSRTRPSRLPDLPGPIITLGRSIHLHAWAQDNGLQIHAVRPIWNSPPIENRFLRPGFHVSLGVSKGVVVAEGGQLGPEVVLDESGSLFRLAWRDGALEAGSWIWIRLFTLLLAVVLFIAALWSLAMRLLVGGHPWLGVLLFAVTIVALRWWSLSIPLVAPLNRLPLFDPAVYATSFLFPSLGDLLINAVLLLVCGMFFRAAVRFLGRPHPLAASIIGWMLIIASAHWITGLITGLVEDSSVDLDLYHVQGLSPSSVVALLSMALLFGAWVVIASTLIGFMRGHGGKWIWPGALASLTVIFALAFYAGGTEGMISWLWPIPVVLLIIRGRNEKPRFVHVVLGLMFISAFSAVILTRNTGERERRERAVLSERLATREDPVVELLFQEIAPRLRTDGDVYALLNTGRACSTSDLDALVRQPFFGGYWERYDIRLFAFGIRGQVLCATDPEPPRSFRIEQSIFTDPRAAADMPDLVMDELPGLGTFYHARVAVMPVDTLPPAQLIVELYPRTIEQGLGFPDLLLSGDDPLARRAGRYTHARYERGQLVDQTGPYAYPLRWTRPQTREQGTWYREGGYEHLATGTATGTVLILGLPEPALLDYLTTFSYLFTFFSLLVALASGMRSLIEHRGLQPVGIGVKVRIVLVLFTITSLLLFGIGTRRLMDVQYTQRAEIAILEKARSVHNELQHRLDGEPELTATHAPYLDHLLGRASNIFFTDITVYSVDGRMLATSRPQMFTTGLLGRRMDPMAYTELVLNGRSTFVHEESIGLAMFRSAYLPLRDRNGEVLAYLSLPTFADQRQQEEERSGVLVAVVNLFVLLFALSVLVAVFISNWTLRPLDLLKRSLSVVGLRGGNEPIRYRGDDEVGQLVQVYNQKVRELHESAEKLAQSERESAWREMARQVAHEIKNPLTPMKLGIQQFQRTWDPQAPDARVRLDRFSTAMVEQIDLLNGVATAFTQFAQMPVAQPQVLDLNDLARAAVEVFHATPDVSITLGECPDLIVLADREHLLRVFNNLLKNAVQAIPDDTKGLILVKLSEIDGEALIEVRDNGSGIPDEARDRIFTPSFTTKSSGMGLGLAMVKRIVEGAGGRVWFQSVPDDEVGSGTSFFVALPLHNGQVPLGQPASI